MSPHGFRITRNIVVALAIASTAVILNCSRPPTTTKGLRGGGLTYWLDYHRGHFDDPRTLRQLKWRVANNTASPLDYRVVASWEYLFGNPEYAIALLKKGATIQGNEVTCQDLYLHILIARGEKIVDILHELRLLKAETAFSHETIGDWQLECGYVENGIESYESFLRRTYLDPDQRSALAAKIAKARGLSYTEKQVRRRSAEHLQRLMLLP